MSQIETLPQAETPDVRAAFQSLAFRMNLAVTPAAPCAYSGPHPDPSHVMIVQLEGCERTYTYCRTCASSVAGAVEVWSAVYPQAVVIFPGGAL